MLTGKPIWAWGSSWSFDHDHLQKLWLPCTSGTSSWTWTSNDPAVSEGKRFQKCPRQTMGYPWPLIYLLMYSFSWLCCKIGQGSSRVIIWRKYNFTMLYIKFQGQCPIGTGEEGFYMFSGMRSTNRQHHLGQNEIIFHMELTCNWGQRS